MLQASQSTQPPQPPNPHSPQQSPSASPSPAASFFARLNGTAPRSLSVGAADAELPTGVAHHQAAAQASGYGNGVLQPSAAATAPRAYPSPSPPPHAGGIGGADLRRAVSLRNPPRPADMFGMSSFGAAGQGLAGSSSSTSTAAANAAAAGYTPPAAARHPLFSHHNRPPPIYTDDAIMSDSGTSADAPPSPTGSSGTLSSGAFSPASAFLSFFSSAREEHIAPDAQGARVLEYTLGKIIGRGGFSTVRQATHVHTGEVIACKIVKRDDLSDSSGSLERFEDEIRIWKELPQHAYLLELLDMDRTSYATFLFMPYLAGGSLLEVLQRDGGSDKTARKWFPHVVTAVAALHLGFEGFPGGMLHGDLKLDNFMTDNVGHLKLGDFGMAQFVQPLKAKPKLPAHLQVGNSGGAPGSGGRGRLSSAPNLPNPVHALAQGGGRGRQPSRSPARRRDTLANTSVVPCATQPFPSASLPYAPPELLCAPPSPPSLAQDIWAVGIILHALLTGRLPFNDSFDPRLQMKILRGQWDEPAHLGHEWLEALHGCMERDLVNRWDIVRVRESDAVTGWREVKPRIKSRSRSRARMHHHEAPDAPIPIPIPGRGRDSSRHRLHHMSSSHSSMRGSDVDPMREESRSRSRSRPRVRPMSINVAELTRRGDNITPGGTVVTSSGGPTPSGLDALSAELESVSFTRGRSKTRGFDITEPRTGSAGSLRVPSMEPIDVDLANEGRHGGRPLTRPTSYHGERESSARRAERSRTRADGVQVPVPGSGPPSAHHSHHHHHHRHHHSDSGGSAHRNAEGSPSSNTKGGRSRGSPGWNNDSRPPTLGSELDAVREEDRGRRGRSPRGRQ